MNNTIAIQTNQARLELGTACLDVLLNSLDCLNRTLTDEVAGVQERNTNMSIKEFISRQNCLVR